MQHRILTNKSSYESPPGPPSVNNNNYLYYKNCPVRLDHLNPTKKEFVFPCIIAGINCASPEFWLKQILDSNFRVS
jgi:hypothetical protein